MSEFRRNTWDEEDDAPGGSSSSDSFEHTQLWETEETPGDETLVLRASHHHPHSFTAQSGVLMWLVIARPTEHRGTLLAIPPNSLFGRGRQADVRWHDPRISRVHVRFTLDDDVFYIEPLSTTTSILINHRPMTAITALQENDQIQMGDTLFVVKLLED